MLITGGMMQKILTKQMMMIFLLIRTLTGTHKHIIYLDMKYGNRVLNKGQTRSLSFRAIYIAWYDKKSRVSQKMMFSSKMVR